MAETRLRILIVEDDLLMSRVLETRLGEWGHQATSASTTGKALRLLERQDFDLILSDVVMPDSSGLDLLRELSSIDPDCRLILMTGHGSVDMAVEALKGGARDFITKPLDYKALKATLEEIEEEVSEQHKFSDLRDRMQREGSGFDTMIGNCRPMRQVYQLTRKVAQTDAAVLITGESGTGKELVAAAIHKASKRAKDPFVPLNVAAIPSELMESELFGHEKGAFTGAIDRKPGCFELAHNGTLLLDEIGEMPMALQPKLLRVLEDGKVRRLGGQSEFQFDVRVIAATNRDPVEAVERGVVRQDLFYRLNVFHIELPPLRERNGDVALLCQHFLQRFNQKHRTRVRGLRDSALEDIQSYRWPGNVRELRNAMERAVVMAGRGWIEPNHLPPAVRSGQAKTNVILPVGTPMAEAEKQLILKTYEDSGQNKSRTARRLGLDVKTVRTKLQSYGVD